MCFASTLARRPPSFAFLDLRNEHRQRPSIFYHSPTFTERIVGEALGILRGEATELSTIPTGQEVSELLRAALRGCAAEWAGEKRGSVGMPNNSGRSWKQNASWRGKIHSGRIPIGTKSTINFLPSVQRVSPMLESTRDIRLGDREISESPAKILRSKNGEDRRAFVATISHAIVRQQSVCSTE